MRSKALPSPIALKTKRNKHGQAKKLKDRVVAGGNRQVYQRNYENIYAPVIAFWICLLNIIFAFLFGWFLRHVDVKATFMNGKIDRAIYLRHPYNLPNSNRRIIYLLHTALYGLKQDPLV